MNLSPVEIAVASDQNYFDGLLVTLVSMAAYCADQNVVLSFHVLDGGIDDESFSMLKCSVQRAHPRCTIHRIKVEELTWSAFPVFHGNHMAYARLALPELLPNVHHLIYCDVDFLWLDDVANLWAKRDDNIILQGCLDFLWGGAREKVDSFLKSVGISSGITHFPYVNSGLLLMNLEMMRKEGFVKTASDFLTIHQDVPYADQDMFNVVLAGRIRVLEEGQATIASLKGVDFSKKGLVIHYAGYSVFSESKSCVWLLSDAFVLWHRMYAAISGVSVLASMQRYNSLMEIIVRRIWFLLVSTPVVSQVIFAILRHAGYANKVDYFLSIMNARFLRQVSWYGSLREMRRRCNPAIMSRQ